MLKFCVVRAMGFGVLAGFVDGGYGCVSHEGEIVFLVQHRCGGVICRCNYAATCAIAYGFCAFLLRQFAVAASNVRAMDVRAMALVAIGRML